MHVLFRVEVVGSTPAGPATRPTDPAAAKIFRTLWTLKKAGYSEDTLKAKGHRLRYMHACMRGGCGTRPSRGSATILTKFFARG